MSQGNVLDHAEILVNQLLTQYQDDRKVGKRIDDLKSEQMNIAIRLSKESQSSLFTILEKKPQAIADIADQIVTAEIGLQRISDEMTFANPIVWMMYKFKAYAGTSGAIVDMADFRSHCLPEGYICTKRYHFLRAFLRSEFTLDLDNHSTYPDDMELNRVYVRPEFLALPGNETFMSKWAAYEYYVRNKKLAKWENYPLRTQKFSK